MDVFHIQISEETPRELLTQTDPVPPGIDGSEPETSVFINHNLDSFASSLSNRQGMYIVAEDSLKALELLKKTSTPKGIQVFTLIAESNLVYTRKTGEIIESFLFEQGYINQEQSQIIRMILQETLLNSIEYGNLGMSGKKEELISPENWYQTYRESVSERLNLPEFGKKFITIQCYLDDDELVTSIEDQGEGFDYEEHIKKPQPLSEQGLSHGMGLGLIKSMTSKLIYDKNGKKLSFAIKTNFLKDSHLSQDGVVSRTQLRGQGKILVVDDQKSNREFARFYLMSSGYRHIEEACNGTEALEKLETFKPDIILLDIIMPEMDGFTTCRKIKQNQKFSSIPILFLSGLTNVKNRVKGYRLGAVDYVNKPIDRNELVARTDIHIQNGMMVQSLQNYSQRIQKDLDKAKSAQYNLLPGPDDLHQISKSHNLKISHLYEACEELAGDYWSIFNINESLIGFVMADFTGHGVAAGLNTVFLHALLHELGHEISTPVNMVKNINSRLNSVLSTETFCTFIYATLNTQTGELIYVGSGAPPIAIIPSNKEKEIKLLDASGLPLGLMPSESLTLEERHAQLEEGDTILLYSDALVETAHQDGKMWEEAGLISSLEFCRKEASHFSADSISKKFDETSQKPLKDDLTLLAITFGSPK